MEKLHQQQLKYAGAFDKFEGFYREQDRDNINLLGSMLASYFGYHIDWHFIDHNWDLFPTEATFSVFGQVKFPSGWDGWVYHYSNADPRAITNHKLSMNGQDVSWQKVQLHSTGLAALFEHIIKYSNMPDEEKVELALNHCSRVLNVEL